MRKITHFNVGNGNCSVIEADNFLMIVDLNNTEDTLSSYDLLKPFFRKMDGIDCIDVLCITHGDIDHCKDFRIFKQKIDSDELIIGSIWHQNYDKRKVEDEKNLREDYLQLQKEIDRRKAVVDPDFGDIQIALKAKDNENVAFTGISKPEEFYIKVLSPFKDDDEESEYDHNDLSLILNVEVSGKSILYTGDASSKYWQDRIVPELLDKDEYGDWANAEILEVGHHGSFDFFGEDRETVRDTKDNPDNYETLNKINPDDLIISAKKRFPNSGDINGEDPPHYAAWKWYHKWFRNNRNVSENDKHPEQFKYTSEGNVRLEYDGVKWEWILNWDHNKQEKDKSEENAKKVTEQMKKGGVLIGSGLRARQNKGFHGWK